MAAAIIVHSSGSGVLPDGSPLAILTVIWRKTMQQIIVKTYKTAAAMQSAAGRVLEVIVMFLIMKGMFFRLPEPDEDRATFGKNFAAWEKDEAAKARRQEAEAKYKEARLPLLASDYDSRHKGRSATKSLPMDRKAIRALPENSPVKIARAAILNNARQDCWSLRQEWNRLVERTFTRRDESLTTEEKKAADPKPTKSVRETFDDFAKSVVSRNQKTEELNAGDLAAWVSKTRESLVALFPAPLDLPDTAKAKAKAKAKG